MTTYGVTSTGFVKKTTEVLLEEIEEDQRDEISSDLNQLATSILGQINGIVADKLREMWDVQEAVYRSMYPDSATGEALDQVASITGAVRLEATSSEVTLDQLFLDNGVTVPAGSVVSVGADGARFETTEDVTNSGSFPATVSVEAVSQDTGPIAGYAGTIDTIQSPVTGWSASPAITNGTAETYTLDGLSLTLKVDEGSEQTVTFAAGDPWSASSVASEIDSQCTGTSSQAVGTYVRVATATTTGGSIQITGGTANTPLGFGTDLIKGFNSEDATPGTDIETDPDFRVRREGLLRIAGSATVDAIRSAVLDVDGVVQCLVLENTTLVTDGDGIPGKAFRCVVLGGADADIAQTIWDNKPAGIETDGSITESVEDSQGFDHDVKFSRPSEVDIYISCTLDVDSDYPSDGDDQVAAAIVAAGDDIQVGEDVIALVYKAVPLEVAGVVDVTAFTIDTVTPPVGTTNITITSSQIAVFDTSRITVAS